MPLGPYILSARKAEQIDPHFLDVERQLADRLGGIAMKQDAAILANSTDLGDRLNHANLIVRHHYRNQKRIVTNRRFDARWIELSRIAAARWLHRQQRDVKTFAFEPRKRIKNGRVFRHEAD